MRFRKGKEEHVSLSIAPLIDIVFLLLIFFMVTSHFDVASGVRIRLPKVSKRIFEQRTDRLTLVIDKSGQTYIEGQKIEMKALKDKLQKLVADKELLQIIIQADRDVKHGTVVQAMDIAQSAGVQNIIIAAQWKSDEVL